MSDSAVRIEGLSKNFRRFSHPGWRALDALGVPVPRGCYDVFAALKNIDLEIGKGQRVGLIGRNGAGKSTLLRLISGQMRADHGRISISGTVQALMELGTGFHPDFSGIENIRTALALQGIYSKSLRQRVDEIIDFSELEEFIERPVREYSAGMYARLAFAVATSVEPEILIVDEILGAGDAYFMGKSIQRMKRLTAGGSTILFVSHDMSSLQLLCDRAVWIDRGEIKQDGKALAVSKAYLFAVREDEEVRARARSMALTRRHASEVSPKSSVMLFRLIGADGGAPHSPVHVSEFRFGSDVTSVGSIAPGNVVEAVAGPMIDPRHTNWRSASDCAGRLAWQFGNFGSRYVHAPWQIRWGGSDAPEWIELDVCPSATDAVAVEQFDHASGEYVPLGLIETNPQREWITFRSKVRLPGTEEESGVAELDLLHLSADERYGSGEVAITAFAFVDHDNARRHTLITGEPASAVMAFSASRLVSNPVAAVAIYRPDGTCAMQVVSNQNGDALESLPRHGVIRANFSPLYLGPGDYIVSVALFKELDLASRAEPEAYDLHDRCYALKILPPPGLGLQLGIVNQPADWEVCG